MVLMVPRSHTLLRLQHRQVPANLYTKLHSLVLPLHAPSYDVVHTITVEAVVACMKLAISLILYYFWSCSVTKMCDILKQKQPWGCKKKGAAKQSRISQTSLFNMIGKNKD